MSWIIHLKDEPFVLNFDKKGCILEHGSEEYAIKTCRRDLLAVIPRDNILYVEWRDDVKK